MMRQFRQAKLLASVRSAEEARLCLAAGADIIDCKDPASGALGALQADEVAAVRAAVPADVPVSATIGDVTDPHEAADVAAAMIAAGAGLVKIGLFPEAVEAGLLTRLGALERDGARLVGVLLADRSPDLGVVPALARAGFTGVMLDTARKGAGALPDVMAMDRLRDFIAAARRADLFAGLAGSLRVSHIPQLLTLGPDVLGFRGALCRAAERVGAVDIAAVAAVRAAIPRLAASEPFVLERAS